MPSLIDLRRRIRSVKNTQQITKAMKMVSAAKLRRAQERVVAARPYAASMAQMLSNVITAASESDDVEASALMIPRPEKRIQMILVTSDRGLAGAFNSNLVKGAQQFISDNSGAAIEIEAMGRKGRDFFKKRSYAVSGEYLNVTYKPSYEMASQVAKKVADRVLNDEVDAVYLIYNEFKSVMSQKLAVRKLLPVSAPQGGERVDYIFEQPPAELLATMLPRYIDVQIYTAILETTAAEHAARMTAMDAASSNAAEVIEKLTLHLNRVRQASITREIIEVVSGASALE